MKKIPGFPYFPVQFDKTGAIHDPAEVQALERHLVEASPTDLLVLSHGWNNDMAEADLLYESLLASAASLIAAGDEPGLVGRTFAVMGVLWPSKKFADAELIPSGAAGIAGSVEVEDLKTKLEVLSSLVDTPGQESRTQRLAPLLSRLEDSAAARREFVEGVRALVSPGGTEEGEGTSDFLTLDASALFKALSLPISFAEAQPREGEGGASGIEEGGAAGLAAFVSGPLSAARNLLNLVTYYEMKERAGRVGSTGLNPILHRVRKAHPGLRLHLVGHSFGGRLVTATVAGTSDETVLPVASLSLLQAAFSHHGFAVNWDGQGHDGAFRRVLRLKAVSGPTIVTFSANDRAVGIAYPIASLVAGQTAAGLGDRDSRFGGIGRNGAQKTPEAVERPMVQAGQDLPLQAGVVHNLKADSFIQDHGDVTNRDVAHAVFRAVAAT